MQSSLSSRQVWYVEQRRGVRRRVFRDHIWPLPRGLQDARYDGDERYRCKLYVCMGCMDVSWVISNGSAILALGGDTGYLMMT